MKKIDEIVKFLAEFSVEAESNPNLAEVIRVEDVGLPLAFCVDYGFVSSLTPKGEQRLVDVYNFLVDVANEQGIDLDDLAYTDTPVKPRVMKVTI